MGGNPKDVSWTLLRELSENVKGFRLHPHFRATTTFAEQMGFELAHHSVDNCSDVLPLVRERWFGIFLGKSLSLM